MNRRALARQAATSGPTGPRGSREETGMDNVSKKLARQLEEGDYYGALQMYKTLIMRFLKGDAPSRVDQEKAITLASTATIDFLKNDETKAALEMANCMISVFTDYHHPLDEPHKQRIRELVAAFQLKQSDSCTDVVLFLKKAVHWSVREGGRKRGDPELQLLLARAYQAAGDFSNASKHFLHAESPHDFAEMVIQWAALGYPSESDLYLARAVLQLLSLENLRDANKVYEFYVTKCKEAGRPVDLPLFNFTHFLLLTLERDALPLFQMLEERYAPALARDTSLKNYLSIIGQKFYGLQPPRSGLSSLLEMFSGGMQ